MTADFDKADAASAFRRLYLKARSGIGAMVCGLGLLVRGEDYRPWYLRSRSRDSGFGHAWPARTNWDHARKAKRLIPILGNARTRNWLYGLGQLRLKLGTMMFSRTHLMAWTLEISCRRRLTLVVAGCDAAMDGRLTSPIRQREVIATVADCGADENRAPRRGAADAAQERWRVGTASDVCQCSQALADLYGRAG